MQLGFQAKSVPRAQVKPPHSQDQHQGYLQDFQNSLHFLKPTHPRTLKPGASSPFCWGSHPSLDQQPGPGNAGRNGRPHAGGCLSGEGPWPSDTRSAPRTWQQSPRRDASPSRNRVGFREDLNRDMGAKEEGREETALGEARGGGAWAHGGYGRRTAGTQPMPRPILSQGCRPQRTF